MYEEKKTCVNLSAAVFTHFYHIITQEAYALFIRISNPDFHTYDLATKKKKKIKEMRAYPPFEVHVSCCFVRACH